MGVKKPTYQTSIDHAVSMSKTIKAQDPCMFDHETERFARNIAKHYGKSYEATLEMIYRGVYGI